MENNTVDEIEKDDLVESSITATEKIEEQELHEIGADGGLTWVSFGYCNEGVDNISETLNYAISQGTPFKVCFMMGNSANQDIKVRIRLVDLVNGLGSVNSTSIYQFIPEEDIKGFEEITIPAGNYIIKDFQITYPVGIEGDQGACTMFNIIKDTEAQGNVAAVVNRAYPMKFFVGTLDDIKNIINVNNIELSLDSNKDLIMNFDKELMKFRKFSRTIWNYFKYVWI